jgi:multicomponent Na+:H+ antiporter subunit G
VTVGDVFVALLLVVGVAVGLISALGVLVMRGAFDRLHYTDTAGLGAVLISAAVAVREGLSSQIGMKAVLLAVIFLVTSPVIAHLTARAARLRASGDLRPQETEVDES